MNFIIPLQVYPYDIMFSVGESDTELKKVLKKRMLPAAYQAYTKDNFLMDFPYTNGQAGRCVYLSKYSQTIIRLGTNPTPGTIAHEIFHAVEFIMERLQMTLGPTNDEAYAHLIAYLTDQFYESYKSDKK